METGQTDQFFEEAGTVNSKEEALKPILTISAIAFDFDFVTSDPSKSKADEIRVLLVKNRKPSRKSKEGKPGGFGLPTGQLESKEAMTHAVKRETEDESGCSVKKIIGKLFVINKQIRVGGQLTPNEIHVFLIEASESMRRVKESDEIDSTVDPWIPLGQVFEMPVAQDKGGGSKNPDGIYFSHLQRLYHAIESMVFSPEDFVDGEAVKNWIAPHRHCLKAAMADIATRGLLDIFVLPPDHE